jgi:hypothetical protein
MSYVLALMVSLAQDRDLIAELASDRPEPAKTELLKMGSKAIPLLREAMASDSKTLSRRALELMAKITGQWGSGGGILWKRSFAEASLEAAAAGRPILLMHLFGKFDEEFC